MAEELVCGYCCHHCPDENCDGDKKECKIAHENETAECFKNKD